MTAFLTTAELDAATYALAYPVRATVGADGDKRTLVELRNDYRSDTRALEARWAAYLADEYDNHFPAELHAKIYALAWDEGHSNGYSAVEDKYSEYVAFAVFTEKALAKRDEDDAEFVRGIADEQGKRDAAALRERENA